MTGEWIKMGKNTAIQVSEDPQFTYSTRKSEKNKVPQIWLGARTCTHFLSLLANEFTLDWIKG